MVIEGIGITILPKQYLAYLNNPSIKTIPISNASLTREIGIVYRKDKYICAATHMFMKQLTDTSLHL